MYKALGLIPRGGERGRQGKEEEEKGDREHCYFKIGFILTCLSVVIKKKSGALHMLGRCSTVELHPQFDIFLL